MPITSATDTSTIDCLIVGAGIAGLTAARFLQDAGLSVLCLDKGKGVGGRLATRRLDEGILDHGAQYFTARSQAFQAASQAWRQKDWIQPWQALSTSEVRWLAAQGMTRLPKQLIAKTPSLSVQCEQQVSRLIKTESGWQVETQQGQAYTAKTLLLTAPIPQCLALFEQSQLPVQSDLLTKLKQVMYAPCLVLLLTLKSPITFDALKTGAWRSAPDANAPPIAWIADNQAKGISPNQQALTVHAGPDWSRAHWDNEDADIQAQLWKALVEVLPELATDEVVVQTIQVKRWRYALVEISFSQVVDQETPSVCFSSDSSAWIAGDGMLGPSVENAFLSGLQAGKALLKALKSKPPSPSHPQV